MFTLVRKALDYILQPADPGGLENEGVSDVDDDLETTENQPLLRHNVLGKVTHLRSGYGLVDGHVYFGYDVVSGTSRPVVGSSVSVDMIGTQDGGWRALQVSLSENWEEELSETKQSPLGTDSLQVTLGDDECETTIGKITHIDSSQGILNDELPFEWTPTTCEFRPIKGDWVTATGKKTDRGYLSIKSLTPLRQSTIEGPITALRRDFGIVDDEVHFDVAAVVNGYIPKRGDEVRVVAIESAQGRLGWRAISLVPKSVTLTQPKMNSSSARKRQGIIGVNYVKRLLEDKEGITVTTPLDFGVITLKEKSSKNAIISNHGTKRCTFYGFKLQSSPVEVFSCDEPKDGEHIVKEEGILIILPGGSVTVTIHCEAKILGKAKQLLLFEFEGFVIGRHIIADVQDEMQSVLRPQNAYKSVQKRVLHGPYGQVAAPWIIPGERPNSARCSPRQLPVSLPQYTVPKKLWDCIKSGDELLNLVPWLAELLCGSNYVSKMQTLLHLEEIQMEIDMRQYDMEQVTLTSHNEYLSLEVPGLAEGRPSLLIGDKVMLSCSGRGSGSPLFEGYIHEVLGEEILVKFHHSFHDAYNGEAVDIAFQVNRTTLRRCHQAVHLALQLSPHIVFPKTVVSKLPRVVAVERLISCSHCRKPKVHTSPLAAGDIKRTAPLAARRMHRLSAGGCAEHEPLAPKCLEGVSAELLAKVIALVTDAPLPTPLVQEDNCSPTQTTTKASTMQKSTKASSSQTKTKAKLVLSKTSSTCLTQEADIANPQTQEHSKLPTTPEPKSLPSPMMHTPTLSETSCEPLSLPQSPTSESSCTSSTVDLKDISSSPNSSDCSSLSTPTPRGSVASADKSTLCASSSSSNKKKRQSVVERLFSDSTLVTGNALPSVSPNLTCEDEVASPRMSRQEQHTASLVACQCDKKTNVSQGIESTESSTPRAKTASRELTFTQSPDDHRQSERNETKIEHAHTKSSTNKIQVAKEDAEVKIDGIHPLKQKPDLLKGRTLPDLNRVLSALPDLTLCHTRNGSPQRRRQSPGKFNRSPMCPRRKFVSSAVKSPNIPRKSSGFRFHPVASADKCPCTCHGQMPKANKQTSMLLEWTRPDLNDRQKAAVRRILGGLCRPTPYIIFGPPGTGKTITVVESIIQLLRLSPDSRILACTPSNSAADLITERLMKLGVNKGAMVRLNAFQRVDGTIPDSIRQFCSDGENLALIARHRLVICTCSTAGGLYNLGLGHSHFTHVFVDEAGQATEPECMVPLLFASQEGQVILAGDPMQLGPVLRSRFAIAYGLQMSFLERLMNHGPYVRDEERFADHGCYDPLVVTKLVNNYRSHAALLDLPSALFYHSELVVCADKLLTNRCVDFGFLPRADFPLIFHGIQGEDLREGNSPSWFNPAEVMQVMRYLRYLYEKELNPEDIGIITPYRKQVEKLRLMMESLNIPQPKVGSVEEFQGQERPVIILSTVRSAEQLVNFDTTYNLGFLRNPKRFNVSITRAQALLIIVGNPHILAKDKYWCSLLRYCLTAGVYLGCDGPELESNDPFDLDKVKRVEHVAVDEVGPDETKVEVKT